MKVNIFLVFLIIQSISKQTNSQLGESLEYQQNLTKYLLTNYDKNIRPYDTVYCYFTIYLRQIASLDEKSQIMTSSSYFSFRWYDPRLVWEPSEWGDVEQISVQLNTIWYPDMFVVNSADTNSFLSVTSNNLVTIDYDGYVYIVLSAINLKARCQMDVLKFPFDTQKCVITISSWSLTKDKIEFNNVGKQPNININSYSENQIWSLANSSCNISLNYERYPLQVDPVQEINFIFTLKRYPLYYMITGIFPCLVLNVVTVLSYTLPYISQVNLSMTTFLTFSVYSVRVSSDIPIQSQYIPLITIYFLFSVLYTLISLVWFILADRYHSSGCLPKNLKNLAEILRKINILFLPFKRLKLCLARTLKKIRPPSLKIEVNKKNDDDKPTTQIEVISGIKNLEMDIGLNEMKTVKNTESKEIFTQLKCLKCGYCNKCNEDYKRDEERKN